MLYRLSISCQILCNNFYAVMVMRKETAIWYSCFNWQRHNKSAIAQNGCNFITTFIAKIAFSADASIFELISSMMSNIRFRIFLYAPFV